MTTLLSISALLITVLLMQMGTGALGPLDTLSGIQLGFTTIEIGIIGAAHSGWRGAFDGIIASVIDTMCAHGGQRQYIKAVIGPCISQAAYEVGPEFITQFETDYAADLDFFIPSQQAGHHMFDLPGFVQRQIARCDVEADWLGVCTYDDEDRFFSYRRTTHKGEADYGRQISAICLP